MPHVIGLWQPQHQNIHGSFCFTFIPYIFPPHAAPQGIKYTRTGIFFTSYCISSLFFVCPLICSCKHVIGLRCITWTDSQIGIQHSSSFSLFYDSSAQHYPSALWASFQFFYILSSLPPAFYKHLFHITSGWIWRRRIISTKPIPLFLEIIVFLISSSSSSSSSYYTSSTSSYSFSSSSCFFFTK